MSFQLDLAVAYVCITGLCFFLSTLLVPLVFRVLARAIEAAVRPNAQLRSNEQPRSNRRDGDWWGPVHQSH